MCKSLGIQDKVTTTLESIQFKCLEIYEPLTLIVMKYHEPWHLGDIDKGDKIGRGTFGKVFQIKRHTCGKKYVLKTSIKMVNARKEVSLMTLLKNQSNIIPLCSYEYTEKKFDMILPLRVVLTKVNLDRNKMGYYFNQMLMGIKQIHDHDLIHMDIKLENIVYDEETDTIQLIDFGVSTEFQSFKINTDVLYVNSFYYRPPEGLITDVYPYTQNVDLWAIGCVMYYMMTGQMVVTHLTNQEALNDIYELLGTTIIKIPDQYIKYKNDIVINNYPGQDLTKILYPHTNLILRCLTIDPFKRPSVYDLI